MNKYSKISNQSSVSLSNSQDLYNRVKQIVQHRKFCPRSELFFEIHIVDHCNLNCAFCSHFSPLAKNNYLDPASFNRDCNRIAQLSNHHLRYLGLCGGEPFLHPNLIELMSTARRHFYNKTNITIITNGTLLSSQHENFWKCCSENDIEIGISKYPIHLDIENIQNYAKKFNVTCGYYNFYGKLESLTDYKIYRNDKEQAMYHMPLDLSGKQDSQENFYLCGLANSCFTLRDGRMYTCATAAHAHNLYSYFDIKFEFNENNSIDIYQIDSQDEILKFLSTAIPFCAFCDVKRRTIYNKWTISKKLLSEWT
jgi:organic radical activating enzyme